MNTCQPTMNPKDRLTSRPPEPLPTRFDPTSPRVHGYPAYPKPVPKRGQGDRRDSKPMQMDIGPSA